MEQDDSGSDVKKVYISVDCKTAVFFANASDGPYSNERSGASEKTAREKLVRACEARALHTRGSRLWLFPPCENDCFAV